MPGTQIFTFSNYGKETVRGTPVAPTRKLYAEGTGVLDHDLGLKYHEAENRGIRARRVRATSVAEDANLKLRTADGVSYDDLVLPMSQLKGGLTGVGGGADKVWTCTPSLSAANSPESFSFDVGDDIQNWRVQYGMARKWKLSAGLNELTQLELDMFGQRAVKTAKATPGDNAAVKIPGDIWTIGFSTTLAGLAGAAVVGNFLQSWDLEVVTGLLMRHYMDGTLYAGQHVETVIDGTLNLTVEATAQAITQFYDKYVAGTLDFIRLKATGPTLGGSAYAATINLPVLYGKPTIIGEADEDEINLWKVPALLSADSPTSPTQSIGMVVTNSLAAIP